MKVFVSSRIFPLIGLIFYITDDPRLNEIRAERHYSYFDIIHVCPEKLESYETKIKSFFREHIHYDEEIRYCMEGWTFTAR